MMEGYPEQWSWTNGIQQERARMILPLAWLYRVEPTEEHLDWLHFMTNELLRNQVPCGGIAKNWGDESKKSFWSYSFQCGIRQQRSTTNF